MNEKENPVRIIILRIKILNFTQLNVHNYLTLLQIFHNHAGFWRLLTKALSYGWLWILISMLSAKKWSVFHP